VSNDNPFSESQFKTFKYRPAFPGRFAAIEAARAHCQAFFTWYNHDHRHSGIGLHAPSDLHHGHATAVRRARAATLGAASTAHPERFTSRPPPATEDPRHNLDQPTPAPGGPPPSKTRNRCLTEVDRFRNR
jgi:putative transposase